MIHNGGDQDSCLLGEFEGFKKMEVERKTCVLVGSLAGKGKKIISYCLRNYLYVQYMVIIIGFGALRVIIVLLFGKFTPNFESDTNFDWLCFRRSPARRS